MEHETRDGVPISPCDGCATKTAFRLAHLGASPKLVRDLTQLPELAATRIVKDVQGKEELKSGRRPSSAAFYVRASDRRLHGTIIASMYLRLLDCGFEAAEALMQVGEIYRNMFAVQIYDTVLQIESLVRLLNDGDLTLLHCTECGGVYLADALAMPAPQKDCPHHRRVVGESLSSTWAAAPSRSFKRTYVARHSPFLTKPPTTVTFVQSNPRPAARKV